MKEEEELVEQDVRDRFKRMCEGYFDNVCKKLVIEHKVASDLFSRYRRTDLNISSVYKNKTNETMKPIFVLGRFLKIVSKPTRR